MIKMSDGTRDFLNKTCPQLLNIADLDKFLLELDEFITLHTLDKNQEATELTHKFDAIYDEIYCCN